MKKLMLGFLGVVFLITMIFALPVSAENVELKVLVNGVEIKAPEGETAAFISEHGQTVIGARVFLDALKELEIEGADKLEVGYDGVSHSSMWGKQLPLGELTSYYRLSGGEIRTFFDGVEGCLIDDNTEITGLYGIPILKDDRTYFPLRALLNWVGIQDVEYDDKAYEVRISIPEGAVLVTKPENVITNDVTVATVNGEKVSKELYEFYLNKLKDAYVQENLVKDPEKFWADGIIEGMNATDYIKQMALDEVVFSAAVRQKAVEAGVTITEAQKQEVQKDIQSIKDQGEEAYREFLSSNFVSDKLLPEVLLNIVIEEEFVYSYMGFKEYFDNEAVRVKHILISTVDENARPLSEAEFAAVRAKAEEILADVQGGADFEAYIESYGEDPGMAVKPDGYIFGQNGQMVEPFLLASLALEVDGISGLVESGFGIHIIKRYPLDESFYEEAKKSFIDEISGEKYEEYTSLIEGLKTNAIVIKTKEYDRIK